MSEYGAATPNAAVSILLRRGNTAAFVRRANTEWMNGYYGLLGGRVEEGESFTAAAVRELKEEAGIEVAKEALQHVITISRHDTDSDWITTFFEVHAWNGEPYNAEPHIHSSLEWFDLDNLPEDIIPTLRISLAALKAGKTFVEIDWDETV